MSRPVEADRARRRLEQLEHQARRRRLAAAGLAHDAERLAAAHAERDVLDRVHLARVAGEDAGRTGKRLVRSSTSISASPHDAHAPTPSRTASRSAHSRRLASASRWQASAWPPSIVASGGRILSQGSKRCGQRGWNGAAGREMDDRRRRALDRAQVRDLGLDARHRLEQPPRVRVLRGVEDLARRAVLDGAPGVHHHDRLRRLGDDAEIVRDQDHADVEVALDLVDQLEDLGLHRRRRARSSARRRSARPGCARAPWRSSRAGACRPRTGAGSRLRALAGVGDADGVEHLDGALEGRAPC